MHSISVFISHSWSYSGHYDTLSDWIFKGNWKSGEVPIDFVNSSVPKNNPIHYAKNEQQLCQAIYERIILTDVIVIPTGMYASYSKWIKKEIDGARLYQKPILGPIYMRDPRKRKNPELPKG